MDGYTYFKKNYHCPFKMIIRICEYFYTHTTVLFEKYCDATEEIIPK